MDTFRELLAAKALADKTLLRHVETIVRRNEWNPDSKYDCLESMLQAEHGLNFMKLSQALWKELSRQNVKSKTGKTPRQNRGWRSTQMTFAGLAEEADVGPDHYDD